MGGHRRGSTLVSHTGRLLVATPLVADPTFERTVVLLLAHGPVGAFGIVVNRPSALTVAEVADEWLPQVAAPSVVFIGGPVEDEAVVGLARRGPEDPGPFTPVTGEIGTVDLHRPPGPDVHPWRGVRLFAGSAGWGPGQLEAEIGEGAWWVVDADHDDVVTSDPATLWRRVVRRQPGELAWFALHPDDPTAN
jgi:putative transcriptional regulator